ncbi:DEAD/DEAH box helicase family protein [Pseudomonas sp. LB3P93]
MTKKIIYTAIAAPGAGKTQAVVNKIPDYINNGFKVVMALPTLKLNDDILKTMRKANLTPLIINSDQDEIKHNKTSVTRVLAQVLRSKAHPLIIVTHDALRRTDPILLKGYLLIIDEIPEFMDINHFTLKSKEAETIFATTEAFNNQLQIKDGLLTEITARVKTYKSSMSNKDNASTLSAIEHKIYDTILTGNIVLVETEKGGIINFHTIVEKSVFAQIDRARETHILAANIDGGLFDLFAKKLGYKYTRSKLTPEPSKYNCPIYIYPMLNGSWSKSKVLANEEGNLGYTHDGQNNQIIDRVFETAIQHSPNENFLVIQNSWSKFSEKYQPQAQKANTKIKFVPMDCRGLNCYQDSTAALLLFSGKPSPNDTTCLKVVGDRYDINLTELIKAWIVKNKHEASLQAVTRTAIRTWGNTKPVYFYVQDAEVANYFKQTYMTDAIIDHRLALTISAKPDGRSTTPPDEKTKAINFIKHGFNNGFKQADINKAVMELWKVAERTARTWTKSVRESLPVKPVEGLEQFFV